MNTFRFYIEPLDTHIEKSIKDIHKFISNIMPDNQNDVSVNIIDDSHILSYGQAFKYNELLNNFEVFIYYGNINTMDDFNYILIHELVHTYIWEYNESQINIISQEIYNEYKETLGK